MKKLLLLTSIVLSSTALANDYCNVRKAAFPSFDCSTGTLDLKVVVSKEQEKEMAENGKGVFVATFGKTYLLDKYCGEVRPNVDVFFHNTDGEKVATLFHRVSMCEGDYYENRKEELKKFRLGEIEQMSNFGKGSYNG